MLPPHLPSASKNLLNIPPFYGRVPLPWMKTLPMNVQEQMEGFN